MTEQVTSKLPTPEEESKRKEKFTDLFDKTKRSGAQSAAGSVAIRPSGLRTASDFLDQMTLGKVKEPERPFSKPLKEPTFQQQATKERIRMILPRNFCPDCDRTDRPLTGGAINPNVFLEDRPHIRLKANQIFISFLCQECLEAQFAIVDPKGHIKELDEEGKKKQAERPVRIKENTEAFIKTLLLTDSPDLWINKELD